MKPIPNFDNYFLSDTQEVYRANQPEVLYLRNDVVRRRKMKPVRPFMGFGGLRVVLWRDGIPYRFYIHQLVALCHIPNPKKKPHVKFLDNNPLNLNPSNLKWTGCPAGF